MIELYHEWNSVHSFKVRVVLAEKKLAWTDRRVELLKFEHLKPEYLRLNPKGVVPTLVHDGKVVTESTVICRYLDTLCPSPPLDSPQADAWLKTFDEVAHPAIRKASFELLYKPLLKTLPPAELEAHLAAHPDPARAQAFREPPNAAAVAEATEVFRSLVARIEAALDGPWLAGDAFTLADVAMAPFAERLEHLRMNALFEGKARGWLERVLARPSVRAAQAPPQYRF